MSEDRTDILIKTLSDEVNILRAERDKYRDMLLAPPKVEEVKETPRRDYKPVRSYTSWPILQRQIEAHTRRQRISGVSREIDPGML